MEARAIAKHVRISAFRARKVMNLVRGKSVDEALAILRFTPSKASGVIIKVIKSAMANAEHNFDMNTNRLFVAESFVDEGPTMKRISPRAQGRADRIRKRSSHITVVLKQR